MRHMPAIGKNSPMSCSEFVNRLLSGVINLELHQAFELGIGNVSKAEHPAAIHEKGRSLGDIQRVPQVYGFFHSGLSLRQGSAGRYLLRIQTRGGSKLLHFVIHSGCGNAALVLKDSVHILPESCRVELPYAV